MLVAVNALLNVFVIIEVFQPQKNLFVLTYLPKVIVPIPAYLGLIVITKKVCLETCFQKQIFVIPLLPKLLF